MRKWIGFRAKTSWVMAAAVAAVLGGSTPALAGESRGSLETHLMTLSTFRCLDVDAGTQSNARTHVQTYDCRPRGTDLVGFQLFDLLQINGRPSWEFRIRNRGTGKCLTYVVGGDPRHVWAESCNLNGQGWQRRNSSDGNDFGQFQAVETNSKCLYALGGGPGLPNNGGIAVVTCEPPSSYDRWRED